MVAGGILNVIPVALVRQELEGGNNLAKAETCDACRGFAEVLYQARDMGVEPLPDYLASQELDIM